MVMQFIPDSLRFVSIAVLGLFTLLMFCWSLREGLGNNMTLLTLLLPLLFTVSVGLFWFLLPSSIFTRIPIVIFYGIGIYSLCLTANIFTVSAIRTIALLRAARGVGFVLTLVTSFLIYDTILSLHANIFLTSLLVAAFTFGLMFQGLWTVLLTRNIDRNLLTMSLISSLIMGEIAASLFFWPVKITVGSLFFTVALYMLLGLGQAKLEGKLFVQTIREYLFLGMVVFISMFIATRWGA